jgi:hypothetical protein
MTCLVAFQAKSYAWDGGIQNGDGKTKLFLHRTLSSWLRTSSILLLESLLLSEFGVQKGVLCVNSQLNLSMCI